MKHARWMAVVLTIACTLAGTTAVASAATTKPTATEVGSSSTPNPVRGRRSAWCCRRTRTRRPTRRPAPPVSDRNRSLVDRLDAAPLELGEVVPHRLEDLGRVPVAG